MIKSIWLLTGVLAVAAFARAQSSTDMPATGPFHVSGYAVEGRLLLKSEDFTRVVSPFVGRGMTAADIERARGALQQTYHDLGHCSVKVSLAHAEPKDGMVTFLLGETPVGEVAECLPVVALDERPKQASGASAARSADAVTYAYADLRAVSEPPSTPRGNPVSTAPAAASTTNTVKPATAPPVALQSLRDPVPAPDARGADAPSGIAVAPYVEGAGAKGLSLISEVPSVNHVSDTGPDLKVAQPASAFPVAAVTVPDRQARIAPEPLTPAPARVALAESAKRETAAVVQVDPVKDGPAVAAKVESAKPSPAAVAAQAEPAKSSPAAAVGQAGPTKPAPAAVVAQAEPAKPAAPEPTAAAAPRFSISRFVVEGNTLLRQEQIDRALAPFTGPGKDFGDVQRALEALQIVYQREGYGGVEIRLPEQELEKGEVKLRAVEPRIGKINVEGNQFFSDANIRHSVPSLREGTTPRTLDIARDARLANENPSKQSAVLLRAGEREEQIDATIRVADVDPKRYSISLDNTGNEDTHPLRLGLAFQNSNVFDRDHVLTAQFITAPQNFNDVLVFGIGYRIPFYSLGDSVDVIAGYSNVDSGTVQNLFNVAGQGTIYAVRYNHNLARWGDLEHKLTLGLEYRAYENDVNPLGGTAQLVPDITVHPFSLTYSGAWRPDARGDLSFFASAVKNIPGGSDGTDADFSQVGARFPDGSADYVLFRGGATFTRSFANDWQARIRMDGQYTQYALVSGEMIGIGGADSVRGFEERYTSNDKGYRTSWEIYTPDLAKRVGLDGHLRFLTFYDQGTVRRNKVQPSELTAASLDSGGVGLRLTYKTNLTFRLDAAYVFHDGTQQVTYNGRRSMTKGHFSMAWVW